MIRGAVGFVTLLAALQWSGCGNQSAAPTQSAVEERDPDALGEWDGRVISPADFIATIENDRGWPAGTWTPSRRVMESSFRRWLEEQVLLREAESEAFEAAVATERRKRVREHRDRSLLAGLLRRGIGYDALREQYGALVRIDLSALAPDSARAPLLSVAGEPVVTGEEYLARFPGYENAGTDPNAARAVERMVWMNYAYPRLARVAADERGISADASAVKTAETEHRQATVDVVRSHLRAAAAHAVDGYEPSESELANALEAYRTSLGRAALMTTALARAAPDGDAHTVASASPPITMDAARPRLRADLVRARAERAYRDSLAKLMEAHGAIVYPRREQIGRESAPDPAPTPAPAPSKKADVRGLRFERVGTVTRAEHSPEGKRP